MGMLILLVKIISCMLSTIGCLVSSLIFASAARVLVLFIHALRVPGQAIQGILELLGNIFKNCGEYLVKIVMESLSKAICSLFNHLIKGISGSAVSSVSSIVESVGKFREVFESLFDDVPEVAEVMTNFLSTLLENLFENYKDAIQYIVENAFRPPPP